MDIWLMYDRFNDSGFLEFTGKSYRSKHGVMTSIGSLRRHGEFEIISNTDSHVVVNMADRMTVFFKIDGNLIAHEVEDILARVRMG